MYTCRIDLLGPPRHWRADSTFSPLERRHALVVAYLALHGATDRDSLGARLWRDETDEKRRNLNLRQLLFRLRRRLGRGALVEEKRTLWLGDAVSVDAVRVLEAFREKRWATVLESSPHLLGSLCCDREPGFGQWLDEHRADFVRRHVVALGHEAERLDGEGQFEAALALAVPRLRLDPWSDEACRQVMALKLQLGDRKGALHQYEDFRIRLKHDLGSDPDERTRSMAGEIRRAGSHPAPAAKPEPPVRVRYPPLVGREGAWMKLKEAWDRKVPLIYVCGPGGHGKSRLMLDFVESQTQGLYFQCSAWSGDAHSPFGTRVNTLRKLLKDFPTLQLEPWVRRQLGRIVPELSADAEGLGRPDPGDPAFVEANHRVYEQVGRRVAAIVFDDAQFLDPDTMALGLALEGRAEPLVKSGDFPPILVGIRPGGLQPAQEEILRARAYQGQAAWIDVEPLTPDSVREMVAGMGLLGFERMGERIAEVAGGSPFFILEIIRELVSQGGRNGCFPADFQLEPSIQAVLARKLKHLSPEALRVAQVIALAGQDLSMVMLASVAGLPFDHLTVCFKELERQHLVQGRWFASGAVPPVVLASIPEASRPWLVRRLADWRMMRRHGGLW